jgi:hypothetical protein
MLTSLVNKLLGFQGLKFRLNKIFILAVILITMKHYCLQVQILNQIITIINNCLMTITPKCVLVHFRFHYIFTMVKLVNPLMMGTNCYGQ